MVLTRPQAQQAFNHVLDNVLGKDDTSPLKQSLASQGITNLFTFLNIDDATIQGLTHQRAANQAAVPILRADKSLVKVFLDYHVHRNSTGNPIADADWTTITQADFDEFHMSPDYAVTRGNGNIPPPPPVPAAPATMLRYTPAELFRRGIKRDPTVFPTLKDEKYNDLWHRSFANQARAQDVAEVLDDTYTPTTREATELFDEKQKYVYAILESKVLTDRGKAIVRGHENDYDAQKVYKKLKEHHLKSTKAMIDSSDILSYITAARLGSGEWKGSTEGFIIHWQNQVRLYE